MQVEWSQSAVDDWPGSMKGGGGEWGVGCDVTAAPTP